MIAEASILSTSPWNSDPLFGRDMLTDWIRPYCSSSSEDFQPLGSLSESLASSGKSTSSSDCGDNNEVGSQEGSLFSWADNELLEMSTILEDNTSFTDIPLCDFEWNISENIHPSDSLNASPEVTSTSCSPQIVRKQRKVDPFSEKRSWSKLKAEEQIEIVEALTQVISCELGLREQLEVIRIIEPNAVISPTDTEFVIDLNSLDNFKWEQVKECVKKASTNIRVNKTNQEHVRGEASTSNLRRNEENHHSNSKIKQSKKDLRDKKLQLKAWKQRQKKEQRQMMKEKRSGLFINEEVLALKTIPTLEEEIDIDILE